MIRAYLAATGLVVLAIGAPLAGAAPTTPVITSSTPSSPANDNAPVLNGTADPGSVINVYTDNSCQTAVAGPVTADVNGAFQVPVSAPADTPTSFYAQATDSTQATSPCSNAFVYVEDSTPPDTAIDSAPPAFTNATASFSFSGSDGGSGLDRLECSLDNPTFALCSSPLTYPVLADGPHTFQVRGVDLAGNTDPTPASFAWTLDTVPPETTIALGPPNPSGSASATFEFGGADSGSGVGHFECSLDNAAFALCASPQTYNALPDGSHTFQVRSVDLAGNPDPSPVAVTWTIDTVHPLVTLTDKPPLLTNRANASFSFSTDHAGSTFECQLDGAPFAACTSPKPYNGLADGSHTFAVRAISLGNPGLPTTYSWTVDTVAPATAVTSAPPGLSHSPSAQFTFTSSEPASTFACSLDALGFTPCASPKSYAGLGDGQHVFRVEAVDAAGNADASPAVYTWQIAGVGPPTVDLTPPANVSRLHRTVGYGRLQLRWKRPQDSDFDHVGVYVSTSPKSRPRTLVYSGKSESYANNRFKNGLYYRYLVVSYDHTGNASRGSTSLVPPSILLQSPRDGRTLRSPPVLRWSAVRKATFYNVQVYDRGKKVLSAWPAKPRRALVRRWVYRGRHFRLRKGTYLWYVWPGFGPKAKSRYGQLLGQGTFKVR
jgi:hypothetical protein